MTEFLSQLPAGLLPFNGFGLILIAAAVFFLWKTGDLQKVLAFFGFKKKDKNNVHVRADAYQLIHAHVKSVGTKTDLTSLENLSGLILKEGTDGK